MNFKKLLSIFVTICMLASMVAVDVSANQSYITEGKTPVSLVVKAEGEIVAGQAIDVDVVIGDRIGLYGADFAVTWDPTLLTMSSEYNSDDDIYTGVTKNATFYSGAFVANVTRTAEGWMMGTGGRTTAFGSSSTNYVIATLHFTVNEGTEGEVIEIAFDGENCCISDGAKFGFGALNGCEFTVAGGEEDSSEEDSSEEDSSEEDSSEEDSSEDSNDDYITEGKTPVSLVVKAEGEIVAGQAIDVDVVIGDRIGLYGADFAVTWDPTLLTMSSEYNSDDDIYTGVTKNATFYSGAFVANVTRTAEGWMMGTGGRTTAFGSSSTDYVIATLHFTVNEGTEGEVIEIAFDGENCCISDGAKFGFGALNGCEFTVAGGEEDSSEEDSSEEDSSEEDSSEEDSSEEDSSEEDSSEEDSSEEDSSEEDSSEEDSSEEDSSEEDSSEEDSSEEDSSEEDSSEEDSSEEDSSEEDSSEEDSSEEDSSEEDSSEEDSSEEDSSEEDSSEEDSSEEDSSEEDSSEEDSSEEDSSEEETGVPSDVDFEIVRGKNAITVTVTAEANGSDITNIIMTLYDEDGEVIETVEVEADEDGEFTYKFAGLKSNTEYTIGAIAENEIGSSEEATIDVKTKSSSSSKRGSSSTVVAPTEPTEDPTEPSEDTTGEDATGEDATGEDATGTGDGEVKFVDVLDRWSNEEVHSAAGKGLVNGRSATIFDPTANLTRSESNKLLNNLVNALGGELEREDGSLIDTAAENWAYESDLWAVETGVMKGFEVLEDGTVVLGGSMNITRQDYMTTVARMIKAILGEVSVEGEATVYADEAEIAEYAAESVDFLSALGVVGGDGTNINPTDNISREEAAAIVLRVHDLVSVILAAE